MAFEQSLVAPFVVPVVEFREGDLAVNLVGGASLPCRLVRKHEAGWIVRAVGGRSRWLAAEANLRVAR